MATKKKSTPAHVSSSNGSGIEDTQTPPVKGYRVMAVQIENVKRVRFARLRFKDGMVIVVGKNGSGKSTVLDAVAWTLTGTTGLPTNPIKQGETHGKVQLNIGDGMVAEFRVTRTFTGVPADKSKTGKPYFITKLIVKDKHGSVAAKPQDLLDRLKNKISIDPLEFIRMVAQEQFEKLAKVAGLELAPYDAAIKEVYDRRREAGRSVATYESLRDAAAKPKDDLPETPVDTEQLTQQLADASNHNQKIGETRRKREDEFAKAERLEKEATANEAEIRTLEDRISRLRATTTEARDLAAKHRTQAESIQVPAMIETADLVLQIRKAQTTNDDIRVRDTYRNLDQRVADAKATEDKLTKELEAKRAEREHAITKAKLPVRGLTFGDGEVLYGGIPFAQASNGEQIRVSTAVAMAANPELRVLWIKDGSLLDDEGLQEIAKMAAREKFQVLVERVEGGPAQVVMEAGRASGDAVDPVAEELGMGRELPA